MDRRMMSLGRAKKKLRYFQSEESTSCHLKIKDVFSMRDLDNIFDDLDSDPGTPLLSPLPASPGSDEQQGKGSQSLLPKQPSPFRASISPLKSSDLLAEADTQVDHLNNKGSPLEEIAPIKTSSPIELLAAEGGAEEAIKHETCPLLFCIENEEPVVGDMSKLQMNQRSESPKDMPQSMDSESLSSPPTRLEFGKPKKPSDPVISLTPLEAPDQVCKTSAPESEGEESQTNRCRSLSPVILIQKRQPEPVEEEQPDEPVQEAAVEAGLKQAFQKKLKNFLQPKTSHFRKQETLKQPARAPSPDVQEEDFMILEDDGPIRFIIPRKTKIKDKPAPESGSVEPDLNEKASPKQTEEAENHKDEPKKKIKAKHGKASDKASKDAMVQSAPEDREDEVNKDMRGGEQICVSPDTNQGADPEAAKQNEGSATVPAEKPTAIRKRSTKLAISTNTSTDPVSDMKKKPSQIKSALKTGAPESTGLNSAKPKRRNEDKSAVKKTKKQAKEQEQVAEAQNRTEPPSESPEQPVVQSTSTANKEPCAPTKPAKRKKPAKIKGMLQIKEVPVPESDVTAEAFESSKRNRKPPGEWWLTQHCENTLPEQQEAVQASQKLKSNRKTQRKAPDSAAEVLEPTSQEIQNEPVTVQRLPKKVKKSQADQSQANPAGTRKRRGRWKTKSGAQEQREVTPEARDNEDSGQLSPLASNHLPKQHSATPGNKRVFDKVYTREDQSGSAQKCPPQVESVPVKRLRKPPRNWWEVPQSQEPIQSSQSPQTSRPQMGPPWSTLHKTASSRKTAGRGQKKNKINMINTPKSVRGSLATFDAIYDSGKPGPCTDRGQGAWQKGRRNLLHSLEEQSEQSSENIHSDYQQQASSHATFDVCVSGVVSESSAAWRKSNPRASSGSNRTSDYDLPFKSGPSSPIELEQYEENEDADLPSSRIIPQARFTPRVLSSCDLCGPPLKPIVLDNEDWDNLCIWFTHIWPTTSKDSKGVSPDDFHWHCHAGRAMGHMVDLQNKTFSSGKILLGSYMKKPAQMDLNAVTVFNVASSCVRVEINGVKEVYNSGQTFMTPCGQSYSIHNLCREPAVLWYHRMLPNHTAN